MSVLRIHELRTLFITHQSEERKRGKKHEKGNSKRSSKIVLCVCIVAVSRISHPRYISPSPHTKGPNSSLRKIMWALERTSDPNTVLCQVNQNMPPRVVKKYVLQSLYTQNLLIAKFPKSFNPQCWNFNPFQIWYSLSSSAFGKIVAFSNNQRPLCQCGGWNGA